jgi:hypothetical protein
MPTLLLTFANSEIRPLPALKRESDGVNAAIEKRFDDGEFVVVSESLATRENLKNLIKAHKKNICLFLFSGHANSKLLSLVDGNGYLEGIAALLAECPNLLLVILNGCSTGGHVDILRKSGIPIVIATNGNISDIAATEFSIAFFQELSQKKNIRDSFKHAIDVAKTYAEIGDCEISTRSLGSEFKNKPMWGLFYDVEKVYFINDWRLGEPIPNTKFGRIVHNIPSKMKKNKRIICKIRIATDDKKLLNDFILPEDRNPKSLEISETMEIELKDVGKNAFEIELISPRIDQIKQEIVSHDFSEWRFAITPLKKGCHMLILSVYIFRKNTSRNRVFEEEIEITNRLPRFDAQKSETNDITQDDLKNRSTIFTWVPSLAKWLLILPAFIMMLFPNIYLKYEQETLMLKLVEVPNVFIREKIKESLRNANGFKPNSDVLISAEIEKLLLNITDFDYKRILHLKKQTLFYEENIVIKFKKRRKRKKFVRKWKTLILS